MGLYEKVAQGLQEKAERVGGRAELFKILDTPQSKNSFYQACPKNREVKPKLPGSDMLLTWLEKINVQIIFPGKELDDYVFVPKVKAHAGAGASHETSSDEIERYPFKRNYLLKKGINVDAFKLMDVVGDSMFPTICDGDSLLFDESDKHLVDGKIFIVRLDESLMVKRIRKIIGGWLLSSDNAAAGDIEVIGEQENFEVIGRVRWFGREIA